MVTRELGLRRGTICTDGSWNGELNEEAFPSSVSEPRSRCRTYDNTDQPAIGQSQWRY